MNLECKNKRKIVTLVVASICLVFVAVFLIVYYVSNFRVDSTITIDLNPSLEIVSNKSNKVVRVNALNEDGEAVLDGVDLKDVNIKTAVNMLMDSMSKYGYLNEKSDAILVSVDSKDEANEEALRFELAESIGRSLSGYNLSTIVLDQSVIDHEESKRLSQEYGISFGKAVFIKNMSEKDNSLDVSELAELSVGELTELANQKEIDISDTTAYVFNNSGSGIKEEVDSGTIADENEEVRDIAVVEEEKNTSESLESKNNDNVVSEEVKQPENGDTNVNTTDELIGIPKAKQIALDHSGLKETEVTVIKTDLGYDDGIPEYDVEFYTDTKEYDYEINGFTGEIISYSYEKNKRGMQEDSAVVPNNGKEGTDTATENSNNDKPSESGVKYIGDKRAIEIALDNAGLTASQVKFEKIELDIDDGTPIYEVEFSKGDIEYSYEINGVTGEIIESDMDN